jgi:hypothetical protein
MLLEILLFDLALEMIEAVAVVAKRFQPPDFFFG